MSQPSNLPSSIHSGDLYLSEQLIVTPLSYSQQTFDSTSDSDFVRPPPPPPESLARVGQHRIKEYVLYSDMSKKEFIEWWLETDYGRKQHIRWDGRHQSKCWNHFDQVAQIKTGEPKVICKICLRTLIHPQMSRQGTSTMNKHTSGVNCRNIAGSAGKQKGIKDAIRSAVSTAPK